MSLVLGRVAVVLVGRVRPARWIPGIEKALAGQTRFLLVVRARELSMSCRLSIGWSDARGSLRSGPRATRDVSRASASLKADFGAPRDGRRGPAFGPHRGGRRQRRRVSRAGEVDIAGAGSRDARSRGDGAIPEAQERRRPGERGLRGRGRSGPCAGGCRAQRDAKPDGRSSAAPRRADSAQPTSGRPASGGPAKAGARRRRRAQGPKPSRQPLRGRQREGDRRTRSSTPIHKAFVTVLAILGAVLAGLYGVVEVISPSSRRRPRRSASASPPCCRRSRGCSPPSAACWSQRSPARCCSPSPSSPTTAASRSAPTPTDPGHLLGRPGAGGRAGRGRQRPQLPLSSRSRSPRSSCCWSPPGPAAGNSAAWS